MYRVQECHRCSPAKLGLQGSNGTQRPRIVYGTDLHEGIDRSPPSQLAQLLAPYARLNAYRRWMHKHDLVGSAYACVFEARRDDFNPDIIAAQHQPWQAITPAPAQHRAQLLACLMEPRVPPGDLIRDRPAARLMRKNAAGRREEPQGNREVVQNEDHECTASNPEQRSDPAFERGDTDCFSLAPYGDTQQYAHGNQQERNTPWEPLLRALRGTGGKDTQVIRRSRHARAERRKRSRPACRPG